MGFAGYGAVLYTYPVFFPVIIKEFGWSAAVAATASSLARLEGGFEGPLVGYILDRWGARVVMLVGGLMIGVGFMMMSQMLSADNIVMYYILFGVIINLGYNACLYTSSYKVVSDWWVKWRTRAISIMILPTAIAGTFGPSFGRALIANYGWRTALFIIGVIVLAIFIPAALLIRPKRPEAYGLLPDGDDPKKAMEQAPAKEAVVDKKAAETLLAKETMKKEVDLNWKQALKSFSFWNYSLANTLSAFAGGVIVLFAPSHLMSRGIDAGSAAAFAGLMLALTYIGRLTVMLVGDIVGPKWLMVIGRIFQGAGAISMANASADMTILAYGYCLLYGIGYGMTIPLTPGLRGWLFGRTSFGMIQGFANTIAMFGTVIAPTFGGYMYDVNGTYYWAYTVYGGAFLLGAFIFAFVQRPKREVAPAPTASAA